MLDDLIFHVIRSIQYVIDEFEEPKETGFKLATVRECNNFRQYMEHLLMNLHVMHSALNEDGQIIRNDLLESTRKTACQIWDLNEEFSRFLAKEETSSFKHFRKRRLEKVAVTLLQKLKAVQNPLCGNEFGTILLGSNGTCSLPKWFQQLSNQMIDGMPQPSGRVNSKYCYLSARLLQDGSLRREWLTKLWIAADFVVNNAPTTEKILHAGECFDMLINASLFNVVKYDMNQKPKEIQVNDGYREETQRIANSENFAVVCTNLEESRRFLREGIWVALGEFEDNLLPEQQLRLLFFLRNQDPSRWIKGAMPNLKLLQVLRFRNVHMSTLPDAVYELFNLRFLDVAHTEVTKFKKKIRKLTKLVVLDLYDTPMRMLRHGLASRGLVFLEMGHKRNLRLGNYCSFQGVKLGRQIGFMTDLKKLRIVEATNILISEIGKLEGLEDLVITKVRQSHLADLFASLKKLTSLNSLGIIAHVKDEGLGFLNFEPSDKLRKLRIHGLLLDDDLRTICSGHWHDQIENLKLAGCSLQKNALVVLNNMTSLTKLHLYGVFIEPSLTFESGCFSNLKKLLLADMSQLSLIVIESGALQCLNHLLFSDLHSLMVVPEVGHLSSLKVVGSYFMPENFDAGLDEITELRPEIQIRRGDRGEKWWMHRSL